MIVDKYYTRFEVKKFVFTKGANLFQKYHLFKKPQLKSFTVQMLISGRSGIKDTSNTSNRLNYQQFNCQQASHLNY